jgi:serine/threonine protein kinase
MRASGLKHFAWHSRLVFRGQSVICSSEHAQGAGAPQMSQLSVSTADDQPTEDQADPGVNPAPAEPPPAADSEGEVSTITDAVALEGEATLVGRELQRGKYRLLALRPATSGASQPDLSYVALHTDLQKRLTLRYLPLDLHISAEQRGQATAQFLREVRALARLSHPSLPRVHDYFVEGDACYVVMDELADRTLAGVLAEAAREDQWPALPPVEIARLGLDLARALAYLHQQRPPIILGGLRAQDVALPDDGPAQLVSLGALSLVASASSVSLPAFSSLPTLPLVSPTPAGEEPTLPGPTASDEEPTLPAMPAGAPAPLPVAWSARDDVYSLGLLLCELAGGLEVVAGVMERQRHPEQSVEEDAPPISLALAAVLEIAVQRDAEQRFQNAQALENALERAYAVERRIARLAERPAGPLESQHLATRLENGQQDLAATSLEFEPLAGNHHELATRHLSLTWGEEVEAIICWKCGARNQQDSHFCRVCGARQPVQPRAATQAGRRRTVRPPVTTRRLYDSADWSEWAEDEEEDRPTRPRRSRPTSGRTATRGTRVSGPARGRPAAPLPPEKGRRLLWALVWVCFGMAILLGSATSIVAYLALH